MIEVQPIGHVRAARAEAKDDYWGGAQARIELAPEFDASALDGLEFLPREPASQPNWSHDLMRNYWAEPE